MNKIVYTLDELKTILTPIAIRYQLPALYLFGSYARGNATVDSDVDLIADTSGTNLTSLFSLGALYCDIENALGKKIDLITENSLTQHTTNQSDLNFRANIQRERVIIYQRCMSHDQSRKSFSSQTTLY